MTDADVDGAHIRTLLLTFFFRHMVQVIEAAHLFIAQPPLFKVKKGRAEKYLLSEREMEEFLLGQWVEKASLKVPGKAAPLRDEALLEMLRRVLEFRPLFSKFARRGVPGPILDGQLRKKFKGTKRGIGDATITAESPLLISISDVDPTGMTLAALTGPRVKDMGCAAPTVQLTGTPQTSGGSVADDTYYYKYTFLYYGAEESNGGGTSGAITVSGGSGSGSVDLTVATGGYGVTARKVYRSTDQITYTLVGTISDNTTTANTDTASAGTTLIPSDNGDPRQFKYIAQHKDRIWYAGISEESRRRAPIPGARRRATC